MDQTYSLRRGTEAAQLAEMLVLQSIICIEDNTTIDIIVLLPNKNHAILS